MRHLPVLVPFVCQLHDGQSWTWSCGKTCCINLVHCGTHDSLWSVLRKLVFQACACGRYSIRGKCLVGVVAHLRLRKCAVASRTHVSSSLSDHNVVVSVITVLCARALTVDRLSWLKSDPKRSHVKMVAELLLQRTRSFLNSPVPGVKGSQLEFLIFSLLHHCFQFLIIGHRYLLMNLRHWVFWVQF